MKSSSYLIGREGTVIKGLLFFILKMVFRKEVEIMAVIYAACGVDRERKEVHCRRAGENPGAGKGRPD